MLLVTLGGVIVSLIVGGWPVIRKFGFGFLTSTTWDPVGDVYGAAGPIVGTLVTAFLSLLMALATGDRDRGIPRGIRPQARRTADRDRDRAARGHSFHRLRDVGPVRPRAVVRAEHPAAAHHAIGARHLPRCNLVQGTPNGANILTASIILAIMILPYMAAVFRELLLTVPPQVREAGYGLGCTPFEVMKSIAIPYVGKGMIGVIMLGLGRALGETMAVTFIIGNSHGFPHGLFDSGSTIASTIANEFAEATGEMHTSALIALGLVLFLITFAVLATARALLARNDR